MCLVHSHYSPEVTVGAFLVLNAMPRARHMLWLRSCRRGTWLTDFVCQRVYLLSINLMLLSIAEVVISFNPQICFTRTAFSCIISLEER